MAFQNNYVVGKGRLYFSQFMQGLKVPPPGAGFLYFGNTPSLETQRSATALDHYDSDNGIKQKDDSIDIETNVMGKFTCDNINSDNLAAWFGGTKTMIQQTSGTSALTETLTGAIPGNYYQIGVTSSDPHGLRAVTGFSATVGSGGSPTPLVAGVDYTFDAPSGLFQLLPSQINTAPEDVHLSYTLAASSQELVIEQGLAIFGQLKFISTNPAGSQRDFYWPYVKLSADSPFALKGDTWQTIGWSYEALKLDDNTHRAYVTAR